MKKVLTDMLVCPACLPEELGLGTRIIREHGGDILTGSLNCPRCDTAYPIEEGIAFLDPARLQENDRAESKYETDRLLSSYLWSHYSDILQDPDASGAYGEWANLLSRCRGFSVDAGSAVGRFTFEMSNRCDFAVGIDNSLTFIRSARELMLKRRMKVVLPQEGNLVREAVLHLPKKFDSRKVEFVVGNALALPFRSQTFSSLASLNLVDKVPAPIKHLEEMNRVAKENDAQFIFSDPFSWSADVANEEGWLGGTKTGPFAGKGKDNVIALLKGEKQKFSPKWNIEAHGHVWWKIRTHANHFELIRSCYVKAGR